MGYQSVNFDIRIIKFFYQNKIFFLFLLLAAFLRFYRVEENFIFSGEVGHNLLAIKNAFINKQLPLIGPPTSHEWLYFGPFFYWLYGPVLILSNFNPISHAYFGAFISLLIVIFNYFVIKEIVDKNTALFSSFFIAVSPLFLEFSRAGRFFSIVTLLVYPFIYYLYKVSKSEKKYLFSLGIIFGSMFSFHFTPLMLAPFIVTIFVLQKVKIRKKELIRLVTGFLIPMVPFFVYDATHGLSMTRNIALWIPYRLAGFVGLYPKNTVSPKVVQENVVSLYEFISKSFIVKGFPVINFFFLFIFFLFIFFQMSKYISKRKISFHVIFIFLWFIWGYVSVFIHGSPPIHYFVPVLSAPIIILSLFFRDLWKGTYGKVVTVICMLLLLLINFNYYFSGQWFYLPNTYMSEKPYYVPYVLQQKVAKSIIGDADGKLFSLHRVGVDDQFEGDYAQNYQYLLWYYGNEPRTNANLTYVIVEDIDNGLINGKPIKYIGDIKIVKD